MGRVRFSPGQELDVLDTVRKWSEAEVVEVEDGFVRVTYTYWSEKWDEWLSFESERIAPRGSKTYQGGIPAVGQRVEAHDGSTWLEAEVLEVSELCFVHYKNYHRKFDEWVSYSRIRPFGRSKKRRKRLISKDAFDRYASSLQKRGLVLVKVAGDGNCLFRSVSHQIYGDDSHHEMVRKRCLDYMEAERAYFEPFTQDWDTYIAAKRKDGEWGDEPEVQALCELYDRPAQVWSYDGVGAKVLRSYHDKDAPPMRLSYYGGGHYDSIIPEGFTGFTKQEPEPQLRTALEASRRLFDACDTDLETALKASLARTDFVPGNDVDELQASLDARAARAHEDSEVAKALELSGREHDDSQFASVLQSSNVEAANGEDAELAAAISISQRDYGDASDQDLIRAIAASLEQQ